MDNFFDFIFPLGNMFLFLVLALPIGYLLINNNMSTYSDSLSHALFPGVILSIFIDQFSSTWVYAALIFWGLTVSTMFTFISIHFKKVKDSLFIILALFSLSLGIFINQFFELQFNINHVLFGSPFLITQEDFIMHLMMTLAIGFGLFRYWPSFIIASIDPKMIGIRMGQFKTQLLQNTLVTLSIIVGFQSFGTLLTSSLFITPSLLINHQKMSFKKYLLTGFSLTSLLIILSFFISAHSDFTFSSLFILISTTLVIIKLLFNSLKGH